MRPALRACALVLVLLVAAPAAAATTATGDPNLLKLPIYPGARYDARLTAGWIRVFAPILEAQAVSYAKRQDVAVTAAVERLGVFVTAAGPEDVAIYYGRAIGEPLRVHPFHYGQDLGRVAPLAPADLRATLAAAAKKHTSLTGTAGGGEKALGANRSAVVMLSNPGFDFATGEPVRRTQIVLYLIHVAPRR